LAEAFPPGPNLPAYRHIERQKKTVGYLRSNTIARKKEKQQILRVPKARLIKKADLVPLRVNWHIPDHLCPPMVSLSRCCYLGLLNGVSIKFVI
jgi:hypothetical protein